MKRSPQEDRIIANMQPGVLCRDGFLGDDRRDLAEIIATDQATLDAMGLTHAQLAGALDKVLRAAMAAYGNPVDVGNDKQLEDERLRAVYREAMGRVGCPWADGEVFAKGHVELVAPAAPAGRTLLFTPLSLHLIAAHGFYQGRGAPYRIEPSQLQRLLASL